MKVAVLCEFSGVIRDAFIARGHDAVSCDLLHTESPGPHIIGDALSHDWSGYGLLICHPPCTYLAGSGARWFHDPRYQAGRLQKQAEALKFVLALYYLPVERVAIENPIGYLSTLWRKPDFISHPYQHGHAETKQTCWWTRGLPKLRPSNFVPPPYETRVHHERPGIDRWKRRSRTLPGVANAIAEQWGNGS